MSVIKVYSIEHFNKVLSEEDNVLVDFSAQWCGPCKRMDFVINELAKTYAGKLTVVKVDIDDVPQVTDSYKIDSIPHFLIFQKGEQVACVTGADTRRLKEAAAERFA